MGKNALIIPWILMEEIMERGEESASRAQWDTSVVNTVIVHWGEQRVRNTL